MDLNKRMKQYEACYKTIITPRSYIIIRLDGKNFSKYTGKLDKPFDENFSNAMDETAIALCKYFNAKFAYTQSDEISLLITEIGGNVESQPELGNVLQKLCSLTASVATAKFNEVRNLQYLKKKIPSMDDNSLEGCDPVEILMDINEATSDLPKQAFFDSRVFVVPNEDEVMNHMRWRQQDATKNSISMAAHALLGHKATMNKSGSEKQEMMFQEKGVNWNEYPIKFKRGVVIFKEAYIKNVMQPTDMDGNSAPVMLSVPRTRWVVNYETPIFTKKREYLEDLIPTK
jgi:tRNA(His) 5'-end guanylyltransferase